MKVQHVKLDLIKEPSRFLRPVISTSDQYTNLWRSVETLGILQPLVVRKLMKFYQIIDGVHRYSVANEGKIPVVVVEATDLQVQCLQIGLNASSNVSDEQFRMAILYLLGSQPYWMLGEAAKQIMVGESWLLQVLGLQKGLTPEALERLTANELYLSNAYSLLKIKDKQEQWKLLTHAHKAPAEFAPMVMQRARDLKK
jgi:ParB family transcriptional regulator, chromosome partitioning protein